MSASSKLEFSSGILDKQFYTSGNRGSYNATSVDRSGGFRENLENPLLLSQTSMARSARDDVLDFFQCLRFDPKAMVVEHKLNRPVEFKQLASVSIGIPLEDSQPVSSTSKQLSSRSLDDLKRLKSVARKSITKARERVKIFNDCLSVINKCFPTIPSRKRSRPHATSNDRSNALLSIDRSACEMNIDEMGSSDFANTSGMELPCQEVEEITKNAISSKRTRTSMVESRSSTLARPSRTINKDKDGRRLFNGIGVQSEDRILSIAGNGWETSKTKKKRSGIKPNGSSSVAMKPVDGYREPKQGMQSNLPEARSRLTDVHGFRFGIANGGLGVGKAEANTQTSSGTCLSISRTESNHSTFVHERRELSTCEEKQRVDPKTKNKPNPQEDFSPGSPSLNSKLNANVRAPRAGSIGSVSKLSQNGKRFSSSNDWEVSNFSSQTPGVLRVKNGKQTPCIRSSSPSVASWSQRSMKISRPARRSNLPVPGNDQSLGTDAAPDEMLNERPLPANSSHQGKSDSFTSATLSGSEVSGAAKVKSGNKNKNRGGAMNEKSGQVGQKMMTLLQPPKKKKAVGSDKHGNGIKKQCKIGQQFTSSRPFMPLATDKIGSMGLTKQIDGSKLVSDQSEGVGRSPTRKLSDRKSQSRKKHITIDMAAKFLDGSDDGHEELVAAANAVTNTAQALSSPFWQMMEPSFRFICDADISYLTEQVNLRSAMNLSVSPHLDADSSTSQHNGSEFERKETNTRYVQLSPEFERDETPNKINLYQRLIAALITDEGNLDLDSVKEDINYDLYGSQFPVIKDKESNALVTSQDQLSDTECSEYLYENMPMNERLLMEIHSIGIYPDLVSGSAWSADEETSTNIFGLHEIYREQVSKNERLHGTLLSYVSVSKELQEKEFEERALDQLVRMAYDKQMNCCGPPNAHGMKSTSGELARQAAVAFVKRALRCYQEFEATGKSCFIEPFYRDIFLSGASRLKEGMPETFKAKDDNLHPQKSEFSVEVRNTASFGKQHSPANQKIYSSEVLMAASLASELHAVKEDSWAGGGKRKELLLDDVSATIGRHSGVLSAVKGSFPCTAKGKRSERDRAGMGRVVQHRSGTTEKLNPISSTGKGKRKQKAKPKQKPSPLLSTPAQSELIGTDSCMGTDGENLEMLEDPIDLSSLQLPDMDAFGVHDNPSSQAGDIESFLNFEDDELQDHDFMAGLEIPMDDLANLNMIL